MFSFADKIHLNFRASLHESFFPYIYTFAELVMISYITTYKSYIFTVIIGLAISLRENVGYKLSETYWCK